MVVSIGDRSECDPTHRQALAPGTPSTVRVTPRSRTASEAVWAGDRRFAPRRWPTMVGLPARRQAHHAQAADPSGGRP